MFEKDLLEKKYIDHRILYCKTTIRDIKINLYSLNIAQRSDLRTMVMFNKIHSFLKGKDLFIDNSFFDVLPDFILRHGLDRCDIKEGSKEEILSETVLSDLKKIVHYPFSKVYLRKYIPKGRRETDSLFEKRFSKTNFIYIDIIFKEETIQNYRQRIHDVLQCITENTKTKENVVLCLQEICPIFDFLEMVKLFPQWNVQDPVNVDEKQSQKSNNVLLTMNFPYHVRRLLTKDDVIKIFENETIEDGEIIQHRNKNQNVKYYIPALKCYLYNIHGYMFQNETVYEKIENIIPFLIKNNKNIIIIGDFNFKMSNVILRNLKTFLQTCGYICRFVPNISNRKLKTYDGYILKTVL